MPKEDAERVTKDVGRLVAELRRAAGLTQEEFAEKIGMDSTNLQRIELGGQNLTIRSLVRLAAGLGGKTAALFERPVARAVKIGRPAGALGGGDDGARRR